jgi:hypothetical protein
MPQRHKRREVIRQITAYGPRRVSNMDVCHEAVWSVAITLDRIQGGQRLIGLGVIVGKYIPRRLGIVARSSALFEARLTNWCGQRDNCLVPLRRLEHGVLICFGSNSEHGVGSSNAVVVPCDTAPAGYARQVGVRVLYNGRSIFDIGHECASVPWCSFGRACERQFLAAHLLRVITQRAMERSGCTRRGSSVACTYSSEDYAGLTGRGVHSLAPSRRAIGLRWKVGRCEQGAVVRLVARLGAAAAKNRPCCPAFTGLMPSPRLLANEM